MDVAGFASTGTIGVVPEPDQNNAVAMDFLNRFRPRYGHTTLPWYTCSSFDDIQMTAACLARTGHDQDADMIVEVLPVVARTGENSGRMVF